LLAGFRRCFRFFTHLLNASPGPRPNRRCPRPTVRLALEGLEEIVAPNNFLAADLSAGDALSFGPTASQAIVDSYDWPLTTPRTTCAGLAPPDAGAMPVQTANPLSTQPLNPPVTFDSVAPAAADQPAPTAKGFVFAVTLPALQAADGLELAAPAGVPGPAGTLGAGDAPDHSAGGGNNLASPGSNSASGFAEVTIGTAADAPAGGTAGPASAGPTVAAPAGPESVTPPTVPQPSGSTAAAPAPVAAVPAAPAALPNDVSLPSASPLVVPKKGPVPATTPAAGLTTSQLPVAFEPNVGQGGPAASFQFWARGPSYNLFLTPTEQTLVLPASPTAGDSTSAAPAVLRMDLVGANPAAQPTPLDALPGTVNYFLGSDPSQWLTNIPTYGRVAFTDVLPGIDLQFHGSSAQAAQLEYDFILHPGASADTIRLAYTGAAAVAIDSQGDLVLQTPAGAIVHHAPVLYQTINGVRLDVAGQFVLQPDGTVGFRVGAYDRTLSPFPKCLPLCTRNPLDEFPPPKPRAQPARREDACPFTIPRVRFPTPMFRWNPSGSPRNRAA
jgi:hypothetical protein